MAYRSCCLVMCAVLALACSADGDETTGLTPSSTTSSSAGGSGGAGGATSAGGTSGIGGFGQGGFTPIAVRDLPNLDSITFWERTGGTAPTDYTFLVSGTELGTRLDDPLSDTNHDIPGATSEFYDVYYSDGDGNFELDGSYLTISGVFGQALPAGGGLNLAEIGLNYTDTGTEYGNYVASYVVLGDNSNEPSVPNCIDGDLQTHTTMGNTVGSTERLRLTLGFESTSGPPPN